MLACFKAGAGCHPIDRCAGGRGRPRSSRSSRCSRSSHQLQQPWHFCRSTPSRHPSSLGGRPAVCATAASMIALGSSFNAANTVFLTQTGPFVGSPPGAPNSGAGGVWIRGIAGNNETTATGQLFGPRPRRSFPISQRERRELHGLCRVPGRFRRCSAQHGCERMEWPFRRYGRLPVVSRRVDDCRTGTLNGDVPFLGVYGVLTHTSGFL